VLPIGLTLLQRRNRRRRVEAQQRKFPAVYDDWTIEPGTGVITHQPTGMSFKVSPDPEQRGFARLVAGSPRMQRHLPRSAGAIKVGLKTTTGHH
jgi:hypothetical protein